MSIRHGVGGDEYVIDKLTRRSTVEDVISRIVKDLKLDKGRWIIVEVKFFFIFSDTGFQVDAFKQSLICSKASGWERHLASISLKSHLLWVLRLNFKKIIVKKTHQTFRNSAQVFFDLKSFSWNANTIYRMRFGPWSLQPLVINHATYGRFNHGNEVLKDY